MNLYNGRNKIIKLFESKDIIPSMHTYESNGVEESEQKFDESIGERVKLGRQEADDKTDETGDEQLDTTDMPDLETEECTEQTRKHKRRELKILTQQQMLSRLPISLALLKAGNNSQKLKNEIRQLLWSLYRSKKLSIFIFCIFIILQFSHKKNHTNNHTN